MNNQQVSQLAHLVAELRASNGIAVVGAGLSFEAGMPLAGQLPPLVWQTLDESRDSRNALAVSLGVADCSTKKMIGDHPDRLQRALQAIAQAPESRLRFQAIFARLDAARRSRFSFSPSPMPHHILHQSAACVLAKTS